MKLLFVGSVIKIEDCTKYQGASVAGCKMQIGVIKALTEYIRNDISILTEYPIASFPRERVLYINRGIVSLTADIVAEKVPFINLFIIKQITKVINAFKLIVNWSRKNKKEPKIIICFNSFPDIALPVLWCARLFGIKTICLLADLPIDVVKRKFWGSIARKIEDNINRKSIKKFDGLAVLNENAINQYSPQSKYIVIDGGFDLEDIPKVPSGGQWTNISSNEPIRVVFSGALIEYNGIKNLMEAAKLVKSSRFTLEVYGDGPLKDYVNEMANSDKRIKYMGTVSNSDMLKIQQQVALLVNPRLVNDPVSGVTFPSKMIEYLLSGTPVVTTKLNCFTQEYLDHMFIFKDESPMEMARTIDYIISTKRVDLIRKASLARDFIIKHKNWNVQCYKLYKFIENLI